MSSLRARTLLALACLFVCGVTASARAEPVRIVILPVVVHTAAPDASYVSRGLQDMLAARIEQLGSVQVLRVEDPELATTRLAPAREAARRAGGEFVLFGAFTQFGDGASLDVRCVAVDGAAPVPGRSIFIQSGTMGEIIPKLDALADKIVRHVGARPTNVAGPDGASGSTGGAAEAASLAELRRRLEALEQAVFSSGGDAAPPPSAAGGPAAGPAPSPGS